MSTQPFVTGKKNLFSTQARNETKIANDSSSAANKSFVPRSSIQKTRQWSSVDLPKPEELFGSRQSKHKRAPVMSEHAAEVRLMCHQMEMNKQLYERHQAEWRALNATYVIGGTRAIDKEEFFASSVLPKKARYESSNVQEDNRGMANQWLRSIVSTPTPNSDVGNNTQPFFGEDFNAAVEGNCTVASILQEALNSPPSSTSSTSFENADMQLTQEFDYGLPPPPKRFRSSSSSYSRGFFD